MPTNVNFSGVSNCYVFKSQLQEYAQKAGLPTPVYETIKEGPSHEPSFRSTVILNNVRYDSLPGFFNRKAAEHSAAEVALMELFKTGEINESVSQPVHETGLCKNLLQEYAQKMNYAMPVYQCQKEEALGRLSSYSCTVEIGGIRYIGAAAKTKKEAEIKAARIALLAIQSSASELPDQSFGNSRLMVIPCRKRAAEMATNPDETVKVPKAKKARFKKKMLKRKLSGKNTDCSHDKRNGISVVGSDDLLKSEWVQTDSFTILSSETLSTEVMGIPQDTKIETDLSERDTPSADVALAHQRKMEMKQNLLQRVIRHGRDQSSKCYPKQHRHGLRCRKQCRPSTHERAKTPRTSPRKSCAFTMIPQPSYTLFQKPFIINKCHSIKKYGSRKACLVNTNGVNMVL